MAAATFPTSPPRCPPCRHIVLLARTTDACEHACRVVDSLGEYFAGPEGRWVWCHKSLDPRPKDAYSIAECLSLDDFGGVRVSGPYKAHFAPYESESVALSTMVPLESIPLILASSPKWLGSRAKAVLAYRLSGGLL